MDYALDETIYLMFHTKAFSTDAPTTLAGSPVVSAYENDSLTQITAGITLGVDHDSVTGLNLLTIVATSGNGYESGKDYNLVITTGTVDGVSVVGQVVGQFSLGRIADQVWDEVLTGGTHNVATSGGRRLRGIQEFQGYENGAVWVDTNNGTAGTTSYENGTVENPVDSIADGDTIASALSLSRFRIASESAITFSASQANQEFVGHSWSLALGSQDISGSYFYQSTAVSGTGTVTNGNPFVFQECQIGTATLSAYGFLEKCALGSTLTFTSTVGVSADAVDIFNSLSNVAGASAPTVTFAGVTKATNANIRNWFGGGTWVFTSDCTASIEVAAGGSHAITTGGGNIEFRGAPKALTITTSGSGTTNAVVWSGCPITIAGTGGTVNIYGVHGGVTDNSSGTTVTNSGQDITGLPAVSDILTTQMTESYATNGTAPTLAEALFAIHQKLMQRNYLGTASRVYKLDNTTLAFSGTLDDATSPTEDRRT